MGGIRAWSAVLVAALFPLQAWCAVGDDVKALVESGKAAEAYDLGKKSPDAYGDPLFDFYFGIAAVDTGHAGDGVLALERYLLNFPDNVSARLQLARGYFVLGEDARAREEFEALQKLNPPADVATTIQRFLDAIRLRETRYTLSTGGYVELGYGHDTNVNSGVANSSIFLPALGPIIVGQQGTKTADDFWSIGGGGYISYPIAPGVALFGNGAGELKFNNRGEDRQFDLGNVAVAGGVSVLREKNLYRFSLNDNIITLDHRTYRTGIGGTAEWQYQVDELQSFGVSGQYAALRYTDPNTPRDADFYGLTGNYRKAFNHPWQPVMTLTGNYGNEHNIKDRPDLGRHLWGGRAAVSFTPAAKWGVALGASYQRSDYSGADLILGTTRHDDYYAADASVTYLLTRNLSVRGEATFTKNHSNIELFTFPREVYAIKLRYEFK
jgi:hypothetical protein